MATTRARWVNVAQPSPYKPGSLVITLTTTRRIPAGAVRIVLTSVIFSGPSAEDSASAGPAPSDELDRVLDESRPIAFECR